MDQSSSLTPNPIVLFASFLLFLSFIYNKVSQAQDKSEQEGKHQEKYVLQEHYLKGGPQVYSSQAQRIPESELNGHLHARNNKFGTHNVAPFNDGTQSPIPDGWPSREPDLSLLDNLSAIHNPAKTRLVESLDNSLDIPFPNTKISGLGREEIFAGDLSLSLDIPVREENLRTQPKTSKQVYQSTFTKTAGPDGAIQEQKYTTTVRTTTTGARHGPVYQDSSDSEIDPREFSKGLQKYNKRQQGYTAKSEPLEAINEEVNINDKRKPANESSDNISNGTRGKLNETNFEPGVAKRRQITPAGINTLNNKNKATGDDAIRVEEIPNYSSRHTSKSKSGKDSKDSRSQKLSRDSLTAINSSSIEEENNRKKVKSGDSKKGQFIASKNTSLGDSGVNSKALRRELLSRNNPLDISYFSEYGSNLSLKKYVAKKTVQEQAFRISDQSRTPEIKKSAPPPVTTTAPVSNSESLFGKEETKAKPQESKTSSLFGNLPQSQTSSSDAFKNVISSNSDSSKAPDSKPSSQETPTLEKKESTLTKLQTEQPTLKLGGLFQNPTTTQETKPDTAPKDSGDSKKPQEEAKTQGSLFGGLSTGQGGLFNQGGDKPSSLGSLFSGNNAGSTQASTEPPKSTTNAAPQGPTDSSNAPQGLSGLFSTMKPGGAPPKPPTAPEKPADTTQTSNPFTQNNNQKPAEAKPEEKKSLFGGLSDVLGNKKSEEGQQAETKPTSSLFGNTNSSLFKPPPPSTPKDSSSSPQKEGKTPSLFANLNSDQQKNTQAAGQTTGGDSGMNNDDDQSKTISKSSGFGDLAALGKSSTDTQSKSVFASGGNFLNQFKTDGANQGGSFLSNLSPKKDENKPEPPKNSSVFGGLLSNTNGGQTSSLFGQTSAKPQEPASNPLTSLTAQNNATEAPKAGSIFGGLANLGTNTAQPAVSVGLSIGTLSSTTGNAAGSVTGSLFGNNPSGGLFSNLGGNSAGGTGSTGLFSNLGSGAGTGLFSNLAKTT